VETFSEILRWTQSAAFVAVGAWALLEWRRRRSRQAGWLGATFGSLALILLLGSLTDLVGAQQGLMVDLLGRVSIAVIAAFPYLLLRFLDSFEPLTRLVERTVLALAVGLVAWSLVVELPETGEPRSVIASAFVLVFVGYWFVVLSIVGWRFWRGGRGQPTLARRRLRILSVASVVLGTVLLLAGVGGSDPHVWFTLTSRMLGLASALLFGLGFAPPGTLRIAWRQPEEQRLHTASLGLMRASSREEVGEILAPHMVAVVGARAVAIIDHDEVVGHAGIGLADARAAALADHADDDTNMQVDLSSGRILVWTSRYTPFFGTEELVLLRRLGLLADLALDRASLLAAERGARHELERTNRELEAFVYTASHDLKSPLIAMLGYLEVMETDYRDRLGDQGGWYLERMTTNGRYMEALIGDLLELSRVGRMQTEPDRIDVQELAQGLAGELGSRYPGSTYVVHDLPTIWINPTRARQLLGNLMENAGKYGGDHLTVEISSRVLTDGGIELRVTDDGVGIPEEHAEKVFGVFERLDHDHAQSGTGVGLAICRKIVESIGGQIWLAGSERGADFRIRLPPDSVREQATPDPTTAPHGSDPHREVRA